MGDDRQDNLGHNIFWHMPIIHLKKTRSKPFGPILFGTLVESAGWATAGYWLSPVCLLGFVAGWLVKVR